MEQYSQKRPCRLSESTRTLAKRAKAGEFGRGLKEHFSAYIEDADFYQMPVRRQYNACVGAIVEQDALRLTDGEWLAGSASFEKATYHLVPICVNQGAPDEEIFEGDSHLTPDFHKVLKYGIRGIEEEIKRSKAVHVNEPDELDFLEQLQVTLEHFKRWHQRFLTAIDERIRQTEGEVQLRWQIVRRNLTNVPYEHAANFVEAVQSLWFTFAFLRALGSWPAVGRIDYMLGDYLEQDLAKGVITIEDAREYLAHFWIKGSEWDTLRNAARWNREGSGNGQLFQNVVLGGQDAEGNDVSNLVTYLILDVIEELAIAVYPVSVRISSHSPEKLVRRVAEVMRFGGGILAVYNDDIVIPALMKFGYSKEEACLYANDGCWEVQIPGKTNFAYWGWDVLCTLQTSVLQLKKEGASDLPYQSFEELYNAYIEVLRKEFLQMTEMNPMYTANVLPMGAERAMNPAMAMLVDDCIARGKDYSQGGAHYCVRSPHAGGLPDAANALRAIQYVVYEKKWMTLNAFMDIVKNDWEGQEELRLHVRKGLTYYGNGDASSDAMMKRLFADYTGLVAERRSYRGMLFPAGISTFGRQIGDDWFKGKRTANPDGHKKGEILSNNIDPTPGTDVSGATALLRSYGSLGMIDLPGGTALCVRFSGATVRGEDGVEGLMDFLYAFCDLGGHFIQPDVVDTETLKDAQKNPEKYSNLNVRVTGWSARFASLNAEWQQMIIERSENNY